jgi:hypothetical protein
MYKKPNHRTPIYALAVLGPRAMQVIDRHKSIPVIGAYEATLGPKVARFKEVHERLTSLSVAYKQQVALSAAEIEALEAATETWSSHMQVDVSFDSEDIAITETRSADATLGNATHVIALFRERSELPYAAQALSDLEAKHESAKAAYDAAQARRVAVQETQRELQTLAADVHGTLVQLRKAVRKMLGSSHFDYQRLRATVGRPTSTDPPDEELPETVPDSSEPPSG